MQLNIENNNLVFSTVVNGASSAEIFPFLTFQFQFQFELLQDVQVRCENYAMNFSVNYDNAI